MDIELEVTLNPTLTSELYGLIGRGISSAVVDANGHLVITMTDGATIDLGNVKGAKGDTGEKGETGDTGATGPQGNPGTNGTDGVDGYSPTVSGNKVGKVTTLVITDKNGQHTYTINDGADGSGTGDMIKETYDPANGARQVAFLDEIPTNAEKASWNAKYDKPSGGIPDSDIASAATWNEKQDTITANGILKGNGSGGISAAVAGTDYEVPNKSDTVWHTIPASEITGAGAGSIKYSRIGRFVQLYVNIMFSTAPTYNTVYATIPYGYKPSRGVVFGLPFSSDGKCYYSEINWNGGLISYDTYPAGRYCMYLITYVTDDAEV